MQVHALRQMLAAEQKHSEAQEKIIEGFIKSGDGAKDLGMAIAIPEMIKDVNESHLYSFFPVLKTSSPFKCILHATYELDDQRNNIIENPLNYANSIFLKTPIFNFYIFINIC